MLRAFSRRAVVGLLVLATFGGLVGCNTSNEIPLVKFPDNMPPPPVAPKNDGKGPQGANTSSGDPSLYTK